MLSGDTRAGAMPVCGGTSSLEAANPTRRGGEDEVRLVEAGREAAADARSAVPPLAPTARPDRGDDRVKRRPSPDLPYSMWLIQVPRRQPWASSSRRKGTTWPTTAATIAAPSSALPAAAFPE